MGGQCPPLMSGRLLTAAVQSAPVRRSFDELENPDGSSRFSSCLEWCHIGVRDNRSLFTITTDPGGSTVLSLPPRE